MRPAVEALLAMVPRSLARDEVKRTRPGLLHYLRDWSTDWQAYLRELGVACPPSLLEVAAAMANMYVHIRDEHGWDFLTPDDSRERRSFLGRLASKYPELALRSTMIPIFGQDGDLMLLAPDQSIHRFTRDDWERDRGVVATDFDALLLVLAGASVDVDRAASDVL